MNIITKTVIPRIYEKDMDLLNKYDFLFIDKSELSNNLFTRDFRNDLRDLYNTCRDSATPLIKAVHAFEGGHFPGREMLLALHTTFHCYVQNAKEYIFSGSWEMLKASGIFNTELSDELKDYIKRSYESKL